jgi:hypothetical protein
MQKIKNILLITTIIISIVGVPLTLSMENDVQIIDPHVVVFDIFLNNQKERLSHQIICPLAKVNKSCEKFLLDTAPERREYLLGKIQQHELKFRELYYCNRYGSLLCDKGLRNKTLEMVFALVRYSLDKNKVEMFSGEWTNFKNPDVVSLPRPFLTSEGDLCCYGWGKSGDYMLWGKHQHLIQYCLAPDNKQQFFRCGIQISADSNYALSYFGALPNLLKAFVNCPPRMTNLFAHNMLFALKDVIIPDNYADYQESGERFLTRTFDELPETLQDAIVKRYQECKKREVKQ